MSVAEEPSRLRVRLVEPGVRRKKALALALARVLALRNVPFWTQSWKRRAARLAAFVGYTYVLVLLMLMALENRLLFPGRHRLGWDDPPPGLRVEELTLTSADGTAIGAWWCAPPGWEPGQGAVLFSHGNGDNLSHWGDRYLLWQKELGTAVLGYDFPGFGKSGGSPTEQSCYDAAAAAHDWLTGQKGIRPGDVILRGQSLGCAMSVELATRQECRAVVLLSPFTSFPDVAQATVPFLPARWLVRNRMDNLGKMPDVRGPVFIAHSTDDHVVPFRHGERLFEAAVGRKQFFRSQGIRHNHPRSAEFFAAVRAFVHQPAE
jgi:pimeloyl-ACP methyl ester carboxylesterase